MESPVKAVFANPSITPYDKTNPAFRIFEYDTENFEILDFRNYFLDLKYIQTKNVTWTRNSLAPYWEEEYRFTSSFQVPDLSEASLLHVYNRMRNDPLFIKYISHLYYSFADHHIAATTKYYCSIHKNSTVCQ